MAAEVAPTSTQSDGRWRIGCTALADNPLSVADLDAGDLLTYSFTSDGFNHSVTQEPVEDKRLTKTQNYARPGRVTETLEVTYVRSTTAGSANVVLVEGFEGHLSIRRAEDNATAWTIGEKVDVITFQAGVPRPNAPTENGVDTITQTLYITADTAYNQTLVA